MHKLTELAPIASIKNATKTNNLEAYIESFGFQPLDTGSFCTVYDHPNKNYVLKIFSRDSCYPKFLQYALSHKNKYLPQFRGKLINLGNNIFAIRVEKLRPNGFTQDIVRMSNYIIDMGRFKWRLPYSPSGLDKWDSGAYQNCMLFEKDFPELASLFKDMTKYRGHCGWDIQAQNVMKRDNGDLVIIDPFYSRFDLDNDGPEED